MWEKIDVEIEKIEKQHQEIICIIRTLDFFIGSAFYLTLLTDEIFKLEKFKNKLKRDQERLKFHNGDWDANLGSGDGGKYFFLKKHKCHLCEGIGLCFYVEDSVYLCKGCINVAYNKMLEIEEMKKIIDKIY